MITILPQPKIKGKKKTAPPNLNYRKKKHIAEKKKDLETCGNVTKVLILI